MKTVQLALLSVISCSALYADNLLHPGTPKLDRPTLTALGVQLPITGDDNLNASVSMQYRVAGTTIWFSALPLFRVHPETVAGYTVFPQFAGSIFDLRPATSYEIQLHAVDPDGLDQTFSLSATTRPVPSDPINPRVRNVTDSASLINALNTAAPGDVITLANGIYPGSFFGISKAGTPSNPIVIRGQSEDGVIIDGGNCTNCNIFEFYGAGYVHLERMTVQNGDHGIRLQQSSMGNVIRRVHVKNVVTGIWGRSDQNDSYVADNIVEGRLVWPQINSDDGGIHASDLGIAVTGSGDVVAHNRISGFGDAMRTDQDGARANDFYGNEIVYTYDNGLELDGSEGNTRCFRNRFMNNFTPISVQPVHGGPSYIFRNTVVNVAGEQLKFHALAITPPQEPSGVLVYNNTFVSPPGYELNMQTPATSHYFEVENNLFIAAPGGQGAVDWNGPIDHGTFDYNGYFPDGFFRFNNPPFGGYFFQPNFAGLQGLGMEKNGLLASGTLFASGLTPPPTYKNQLPPADVTLAAGSVPVDRGRILPNISDNYQGRGPDIGALELGCPLPTYGPRAEGVDETNEVVGCSNAARATSATFVKADATTKGNWKSGYGADGYTVVGDQVSNPSYAAPVASGYNSYIWAASTTDARALQKATNPADRIAATWYSNSPFLIDTNITDLAPHQVALYCLDYDSTSRQQTVDVLDSNGNILNTQSLANFNGGVYLVWTVTGHVKFRLNWLTGYNAVVSGFFFGGARPATSATFVKGDATTKGNWKQVYGLDGYSIIGDQSLNPSYAAPVGSGYNFYTWAASTSDTRALQKASNPADRIAATWYSNSPFLISTNISDRNQHQVALYCVDYDSTSRQQTVDVLDEFGDILNTQSLANFNGGTYLIWNVSGPVKFRLNWLTGFNAIVSGVFFR